METDVFILMEILSLIFYNSLIPPHPKERVLLTMDIVSFCNLSISKGEKGNEYIYFIIMIILRKTSVLPSLLLNLIFKSVLLYFKVKMTFYSLMLKM